MRRRGCGCLGKIVFIALLILVLMWGFNNKDQILGIFYPREYEETIDTYCHQYNVDKWLVFALIKEESGFDPDAVSVVGAHGLMQLMPPTADWLIDKGGFAIDNDDALHEVDENIQLGVYYLALLMEAYADENGDIDLALVIAAYNAGIGSVEQWLVDGTWDGSTENMDDIPYGETLGHVEGVLSSYKVYQYLYNSEKSSG